MADQTVTINIKANVGNAVKGLKDVETQQNRTSKSTDNLSAKMSTARNANLGLNRVIQDSPFFFTSFNMGVMATANNIPFLVEQMAKLRSQTSSLKEAFKAFASTFMGASGVLTLISLGVSGLLAYTIASRDSKDATDKLNKSWLEGVTDLESYSDKVEKATRSLNKFNKEQLEQVRASAQARRNALREEFSTQSKEIDNLKDTIDDLKKSVGEARVGFGLQLSGAQVDLDKLRESQTKTWESLQEANKIFDDASSRLKNWGKSIVSLEVQLQDLRDELSLLGDADPSRRKELIKQIEGIEKAISRLQGKDSKSKISKDPFDIKTFAEFRAEIDGFMAKRDKLVKGTFDWYQANQKVKESMQALIDATLKSTGADKALEALRKFQEAITKSNIASARNRQAFLSEQAEKEARDRLQAEKDSLMERQRMIQQFASTMGSAFTSMWKKFFDSGRIEFQEFLNNILAGLASIATQKLALNIAGSVATGGIPIISDIFEWLMPSSGASKIGGTSSGMQKISIQIGEDNFVEGMMKIQPQVDNRISKTTRTFN